METFLFFRHTSSLRRYGTSRLITLNGENALLRVDQQIENINKKGEKSKKGKAFTCHDGVFGTEQFGDFANPHGSVNVFHDIICVPEKMSKTRVEEREREMYIDEMRNARSICHTHTHRALLFPSFLSATTFQSHEGNNLNSHK